MQTIKLLICALLLSLIPGQLVRIQINENNAVTITDILAILTIAAFFYYMLINKKNIIVPRKIFVLGILFIISAISSSILALTNFRISEVLISSLFIVRLSTYFFLSVVTASIIKKAEVHSWLKLLMLIAVAFTILGFIQFILFRDLSILEQYGWDPHVSRLVSTTLDPNYTGGLLVIFSCISISFFLYKKRIIYLLLTAIFTFALFLTFSRSSYLSYLTAMSLIGIIKSPKLIIVAIFLFLFSFIIFASVRERIIGAFLIDKTANARIESWQKAIVIFRERPFFGVGFNAYRYAQAQHGFIITDTGGGGHSGAGVDSTLLLVAATTGLVGFSLYVGWLVSILSQLKRNYKKSPISLAVFVSFIAILVHTIFVNSLFYPQIMLILWFLIGLQFVNDY